MTDTQKSCRRLPRAGRGRQPRGVALRGEGQRSLFNVYCKLVIKAFLHPMPDVVDSRAESHYAVSCFTLENLLHWRMCFCSDHHQTLDEVFSRAQSRCVVSSRTQCVLQGVAELPSGRCLLAAAGTPPELGGVAGHPCLLDAASAIAKLGCHVKMVASRHPEVCNPKAKAAAARAQCKCCML